MSNIETKAATVSGERRLFPPGRIVALVIVVLLIAGLGYLRFGGESSTAVPEGAQDGDLTAFEPCTQMGVEAECASMVVRENRSDPASRLIALPITRFPAASASGEPIFYQQGGPGVSNALEDPDAIARLSAERDVVFVGFRGVEGSSVLACPEVTRAVKASTDLVGESSRRRTADAYTSCAERLTAEGVDLDGYTLPERAADIEEVRVALGYDRINLLSESAGTRTAMIYAWRYPESIKRSVMYGINPPGNYLWYGSTTDEQLEHYGELCARDESCSSKTDDLVATLQEVSNDMPERWMSFSINEGNAKVASFFGLFEQTDAAYPLNGPGVLDSWLAAADGDASGMWLLNAAFMLFPEQTWGERAATGIIDRHFAEEYYERGGDPSAIFGEAPNDFGWLGGELIDAWPAGPGHELYQQVQPSDVETLLIGGSVDFSTPAVNATEQFLPYLRNGRQVVLEDFGHTIDFWTAQPEAWERLLDHYYDTGEVDDSQFEYQAIDFTPATTHGTVAKIAAGTMAGFAALLLIMLVWMPSHVSRKGAFGRVSGAVLRGFVVPLLMGLGGWFAAWLVLMTVWPSMPANALWVTVISVGVPIGIGTYWAWVHREWNALVRRAGIWLAAIAGVVGGWLGFHATTGLLAPLTALVGAAVAVNLALIVWSVLIDSTGIGVGGESSGAESQPESTLGEPISVG